MQATLRHTACIALPLCHIVRILHCQSVIIVRLSRLSMPAPGHQLPIIPLLLPDLVSDFSGVITKHTNNNAAFGYLAQFRSGVWQHFTPSLGGISFGYLTGLLVGSRQDDMGTPHLCGPGRAGDSILNSHHIFRKKLP